MTTDACATPGCGHSKETHTHNAGGCCRWCPCAAYLPPRPVPEEPPTLDDLCPCGHTYAVCQIHFLAMRPIAPATVPAPRAEAKRAYVDWSGDHHNRLPREQAAFVAGYIRAKEDDA